MWVGGGEGRISCPVGIFGASLILRARTKEEKRENIAEKELRFSSNFIPPFRSLNAAVELFLSLSDFQHRYGRTRATGPRKKV